MKEHHRGALYPAVPNKPQTQCIVGKEEAVVTETKSRLRKFCSVFHFLQHPARDIASEKPGAHQVIILPFDKCTLFHKRAAMFENHHSVFSLLCEAEHPSTQGTQLVNSSFCFDGFHVLWCDPTCLWFVTCEEKDAKGWGTQAKTFLLLFLLLYITLHLVI